MEIGVIKSWHRYLISKDIGQTRTYMDMAAEINWQDFTKFLLCHIMEDISYTVQTVDLILLCTGRIPQLHFCIEKKNSA